MIKKPWFWKWLICGLLTWGIARSAPGGNQTGEAANAAASPVHEHFDSKLRQELLNQAESDLARGKTDLALAALEKAAQMTHAADTEMLQVRAMMQAGNYAQAASFAAHTAGAHIDEGLAPTAIYAWLLTIGGQKDFAERMLNDAISRDPSDRMALEVKHLMEDEGKPPSAYLLTPPHRLAPYITNIGNSKVPSTKAVIKSNGVLWNGGQEALVSLLPSDLKSRLWVRNGLGQTVKATPLKQLAQTDIFLLKLGTPLAMGPAAWTVSDPFPGSAGYVSVYPPVENSSPSWPRLYPGFLGGPSLKSPVRRLGISLPTGQSGGAIFDSSGKLAGITVTTKGQSETYLTVSDIRKNLGLPNERIVSHSSGLSTGMEQIYESAMRSSLQVIVESAAEHTLKKTKVKH